MKFIFGISLVALLIGCSDGGDFGDNKHTIPLIVVDTGSCSGGEGFFGGNYECTVQAKGKSGRLEYLKVYGDVMKGMTIYKHCWNNGDGTYCFSTARTSIRAMYRI